MYQGRITKESALTFVELPPTQHGKLSVEAGILGSKAQGHRSHDLYSEFSLPDRANGLLLGIARANGWNNSQVINPKYHGRKDRLTKSNWSCIMSSDVLALSAITRTIPQTYELADQYHKANPNGVVVMGGVHATFLPEEALQHADVVVMYEAEKTLPLVLEGLINNNLDRIPGIGYRRDGEIEIDSDRPYLLTSEELGDTPLPIYDPAIRNGVDIATIRTTVGCPHSCTFCSVTEFNGNRYRTIPVPRVIEEVKSIQDMGSRRLMWVDDNLTANSSHLNELSDAIVEEGLVRKGLGQLDIYGAKPEKIEAMRRMGIDAVCIGFESNNPAALMNVKKKANSEKNTETAKAFKDYGFWLHGMMIVGLDGDTPESARELLEWSKKYLDSVQFFVPIPLPGARLYEQMKEEGRILTEDFSLYDAGHVIIRPLPESGFTPLSLQKTSEAMFRDFYSIPNSARRFLRSKHKRRVLGLAAYVATGAINRGLRDPASLNHLKFLESVS